MTKKRHKMVVHSDKLANVFNYAKVDLEELHSEMESYFENLPEGLQESTQGEAASRAADALSDAYREIEDLDFDDPHGENVTIKYQEMRPYGKKVTPRHMRAFTIQAQLTAVKDELESTDDLTGEADESEAVESLGEAIEELSTVEFPGMYGR